MTTALDRLQAAQVNGTYRFSLNNTLLSEMGNQNAMLTEEEKCKAPFNSNSKQL